MIYAEPSVYWTVHLLRNPHGRDEEMLRANRLRAADLIEDLQAQVKRLTTALDDAQEKRWTLK